MSPMKMVEVFVIPSIDVGSKLFFVDIGTSKHTENSKFRAIGVARVLFRALQGYQACQAKQLRRN